MTQLYDYANRPIKPPARPETRELPGAVSIRDRYSSYPSAGLTPSRLTQIFRQADYGWLQEQAWLFEEMEEKDCHLASTLQTRKLAVLSLDWEVQPASESAEDKKIAEHVEAQLKDLSLRKFLLHALDAIGKGYSGTEILWDTSSGIKAAINGLKPIPAKNFTYVNSLIPRLLTEENQSDGIEFPPFKIVFHTYEARSGYPFRNGVLRVAAWMYLFKSFSVKDWVIFNEVFGMPLRVGKYETSATEADKQALREGLVNLGSDACALISMATTIEFPEVKSRLSGTTNPFEVLVNFCDRAMSKAVLGQTLTTDTTGATGTYAAGAVHGEVRRDLVEADAATLGETVKEQLVWPIVGFNFGWDKPLPNFRLIIQEEQDLKADSEVVGNLVKAGAGKRIPAKWINEHFGIPEPGEGEETLGQAEPEPEPPEEEPGKGKKGKTAAMKAVLPLKDGGMEIIPQDAQVIQTQQELENLAQTALTASAEAAALMLAPVRAMILRAESLEKVLASIIEIYPDLDLRGQVDVLHQAMVLAELKGRSS